MKSDAQLEEELGLACAVVDECFKSRPREVVMCCLGLSAGCAGQLTQKEWEELLARMIRGCDDPELQRVQMNALRALRQCHAETLRVLNVRTRGD